MVNALSLLALLISMTLSPYLQANFSVMHSCEERSFDRPLYPVTKAIKEGYLNVSEKHSLYYATYGNPQGIPVVICHGGPGGGCDDTMVQFFDLSRWHVIMFDQRGAMRSEPFGCMDENSPQHSVSDINRLREHLGISKWVVFGGSWGSSLALLYAQEHAQDCLGLILRGVWLARKQDVNHLLYGMGKIFPEAYEAVVNFISEEEREDLLSAYYRRTFDPSPYVHLPAARTFMKFDAICCTHRPAPNVVEDMLRNDDIMISVMRAFFHFAKNDFFLKPNQILSNIHKIDHLPSIIVQGRYDVICFPELAYLLHKQWTNSQLWMIPEGGHSDDELPMAAALCAATDLFAEKLNLLPPQ